MGKYPNSKIHDMFSDWHWNYCKGNACLTDIDRIWAEIRKQKIIVVWDLKTPYEFENKEEPKSEGILRDFFENQNIPYFVVVMDNLNTIHPHFTIHRHGRIKQLSHSEMIEYINNLEHKVNINGMIVEKPKIISCNICKHSYDINEYKKCPNCKREENKKNME